MQATTNYVDAREIIRRQEGQIGKERLGKLLRCWPNTAARLLARYHGETRGHSNELTYRRLLQIAKQRKYWTDHALAKALGKEAKIDHDQARRWVAWYRGATLPPPKRPSNWKMPSVEKPNGEGDLYGQAKRLLHENGKAILGGRSTKELGSQALAVSLGCTKTTARCLRQRYWGETQGHAKDPLYLRVIETRREHPHWGYETIAQELELNPATVKLWLARYKGALTREWNAMPQRGGAPKQVAASSQAASILPSGGTQANGANGEPNSWDRIEGGKRVIGARGREITTVEALLRREKVDATAWHLESSNIERRDHPDGEITTVKVILRKSIIEERIQSISQSVANGIQAAAAAKPITAHRPSGSGLLFELSLPDLHIGKYAAKDETGEQYNVEIATKLARDATDALLTRAAADKPERILLVIGNDFYNVDSEARTTFNGTPQDEELRLHETFVAGKGVSAYQIRRCLEVAKTDVVFISGNHDKTRLWQLSQVMEAQFGNTPGLTFDSGPALRKYYVWGKVLLSFTHGNIKHERLPMLMANDQPQAWANSVFREVQLGHFHARRLKVLDLDLDAASVRIRIQPSLCAKDAWHAANGYHSRRAAEGYLYHRDFGPVSEYFYTPGMTGIKGNEK